MEIFHICCVYLRTTKLNSDIIKVGTLECIVAVKADALCSCLLLPRANKHTRNKRSVSITINRFHIVSCVMRDRSSSNFWYRMICPRLSFKSTNSYHGTFWMTGGTCCTLVKCVIVCEGIGITVVTDVFLMEEFHIRVIYIGVEEAFCISPILQFAICKICSYHSTIHRSTEHGLYWKICTVAMESCKLSCTFYHINGGRLAYNGRLPLTRS